MEPQADDLRATLLLSDYAVVADGKLTVVGAGWSYTGPDPCPSAVGIKIDVPWGKTNVRHEWTLVLKDGDGKPFVAPDGNQVQIGGQFEAGRPPGHPAGTTVTLPLALNVPPLPLEAGRYEWELSINGHTQEDWKAGFSVRPRAA